MAALKLAALLPPPASAIPTNTSDFWYALFQSENLALGTSSAWLLYCSFLVEYKGIRPQPGSPRMSNQHIASIKINVRWTDDELQANFMQVAFLSIMY